MSLQVIQDSNGHNAGVFIPINDWEVLKQKYKGLESLENINQSKNTIIKSLEQSIKEVKLIKSGKIKAKPLKSLLDEI